MGGGNIGHGPGADGGRAAVALCTASSIMPKQGGLKRPHPGMIASVLS